MGKSSSRSASASAHSSAGSGNARLSRVFGTHLRVSTRDRFLTAHRSTASMAFPPLTRSGDESPCSWDASGISGGQKGPRTAQATLLPRRRQCLSSLAAFLAARWSQNGASSQLNFPEDMKAAALGEMRIFASISAAARRLN